MQGAQPCGPWSPPLSAPLGTWSQAGIFAMWVVDHETYVELGDLVFYCPGKQTSKWQIEGTAGRTKFTTAVGQVLLHFPSAHDSGR